MQPFFYTHSFFNTFLSWFCPLCFTVNALSEDPMAMYSGIFIVFAFFNLSAIFKLLIIFLLEPLFFD